MAKMVLIEAHPLLRLGLWQILREPLNKSNEPVRI